MCRTSRSSPRNSRRCGRDKIVNLALWLHRAGLSHGDRPALGLGARVIRRYGEVAGRAARLAASLRERFGLQAGRARRHRGEELHRLCRAHVRHLARGARRGAGQRQTARPRARLHFAAFRRPRLLRFRRARHRDRAARAADAGTSDRARQPRLRGAVRRRSDRAVAVPRRRSGVAVLHLRHHGPAEGRHAHPSRAGGGELRLCERGQSDRARQSAPACRADEPRLRPLHDGARGAARRQRRAGIERL